ncbi:hypothetical protein A2U01_0049622 [Trifolium medium]|uniref:Retrotransposon gag protein n=1 Tax=Trifolium medium TaxID=97028 RepID=A0A392QVM9_9FABA|nr:hypothetical protein [Trifolium medium]
MAPFEALYGRRCRTPLCWYESGENVILGPKIVQETTEKIKMIRKKMKASQNRQKSYHDKRRKDIEFQEGDHVFLRVTSTTGVGRALKSKKINFSIYWTISDFGEGRKSGLSGCLATIFIKLT